MMKGNHKNAMLVCMQIQNYNHSFERLLEFDSFSLQELILLFLMCLFLVFVLVSVMML